MDEDKDEIVKGDWRKGVAGDPSTMEVMEALISSEVRISRRTREFMALILLIGILVVAGVVWSGRTENALTTAVPAVSRDLQAGDGSVESTPDVRYVTRGEWIDPSELWARFGVLGAAYDGETIVMSTAESRFGSLGCRVSPRGRPMNGTCYEVGKTSTSKLLGERDCVWQVAFVNISPTRIRGKRVLKTEESDPGCAQDYKSLPSPFTLERPHGQPDRPVN